MNSLVRKIPSKSIILDCSWHFKPGFSGLKEYNERHIPGARFLDLDLVSDQLSSFPHMLPTESVFADHMGKLGIERDDTVICYDSFGIFSSARIWWTLKVFGHKNVAVLDGGLKKWIEQKGELETKTPTWSQTVYGAEKRNDSMLIDYPDLMNQIIDFNSSGVNPMCMVDARPAGRFSGAESEPRPGISSGHAPGSISLPFGVLLNADGTMKSKEELILTFQERRIDLNSPIVTSCGSGVTAAIIYLALDVIGKRDVRLYDGSWAEYASMKTSPIQKH